MSSQVNRRPLPTVEEEHEENLENLILKLKNLLKTSKHAKPATIIALLNNLTLYGKQIEEIQKVASSYDSLTGMIIT
jgi:hypothetical protein